MTHAPYLRDKAREIRVSQRLTIDQIAERLALPRGAIYHWVRDLPVERRHFDAAPSMASRRRAVRAMQARFKQARDEAYELGVSEFDWLAIEPTFRDFVCLYIAEGYKRDRNAVTLCNSDAAVMKVAQFWIARFAVRPPWYSIAYHADQDLDELTRWWGTQLSIDPTSIRLYAKSNSGRLAHRRFRSAHSVLTVGANDTLLRARLQGWMDRVRGEWL